MFDIPKNLKLLPDKPGVYIHRDALGHVIYVGKAVSLKNRVRQYFQSQTNMPPKVRAMVSHIAEFEYITTDSEMEALILECNLIKKYQPKYNVLLRDDKTYPYIKVTLQEDYPRVVKTRRVLDDGAEYFGPYSDVGAVNEIVDLLNRVHTLKRCSARSFPEGFRPCLNYHIEQCRGICRGSISREEYRKSVDAVIRFLKGHSGDMIEMLTEKMMAASDAMNFERAAEYRDQIAAVKAIREKQKVVLGNASDMDLILTAHSATGYHIILFFVRNGNLSGRETFQIAAAEEDSREDVTASFIKQYYSKDMLIPREVAVEWMPPDAELLGKWLTDMRGAHVRIFMPQKGAKKELMDMARRDVSEMMKVIDDRAAARRERVNAVTAEMNRVFGQRLRRLRAEDGGQALPQKAAEAGAEYAAGNWTPEQETRHADGQAAAETGAEYAAGNWTPEPETRHADGQAAAETGAEYATGNWTPEPETSHAAGQAAAEAGAEYVAGNWKSESETPHADGQAAAETRAEYATGNWTPEPETRHADGQAAAETGVGYAAGYPEPGAAAEPEAGGTPPENLQERWFDALELSKGGGRAVPGAEQDVTWRIESYDISNIAGVDSVGAMVVFENGKPQRKSYRKFRIRTVNGPDDYSSMQEVIYRRFRRAQKGDPGFLQRPDVIFVDGGLGHVHAVQDVLDAMGERILVAGMVKDDRHRTRGLIVDEQEMDLRENPVLFRYVTTIQDEVHRFAIGYHHDIREKSMSKSILDTAPGIGTKRKKNLLQRFGSIENLRRATVSEIAETDGMNRSAAEKLKEYLTLEAPVSG